ncbi:MAG: DUF2085 domain-containing protein [Candidatus Micrarchaeota archaeon]
MDRRAPYFFVAGFLLVLNLSIFAPPFLVFTGFEGAAAALYNIHSYDHQWIYRSQCVFWGDTGLRIEDCIVQGKESEANISTLYTLAGDPAYNGVFGEYPQSQIGRNKAERVERNGMVGYKFANDTRDYAIYLPMLAALLAYPSVLAGRITRTPHVIWLIIALVPMAIDGTTQALAGIFGDPGYYWLSAFGLHESTNLLRWVTGGIAGTAAGVYMGAMIYPREKEATDGKIAEGAP